MITIWQPKNHNRWLPIISHLVPQIYAKHEESIIIVQVNAKDLLNHGEMLLCETKLNIKHSCVFKHEIQPHLT